MAALLFQHIGCRAIVRPDDQAVKRA